MQVHDMEQYSDEWWAVRRGLPTASRMSVLFTSTLKPSKSAGIDSYAAELAADLHARRTLSHEEGFQGNSITQRGHDLEPQAAANYEIDHANSVAVGFVTNKGAGCSPDRLVGDDGLLEIKCPLATKYTLYAADIASGACPADHIIQCQSQIWICEREWCDLCVYHPHLGMAVHRVTVDPEIQDILSSQVDHLLKRRDFYLSKLQSLKP